MRLRSIILYQTNLILSDDLKAVAKCRNARYMRTENLRSKHRINSTFTTDEKAEISRYAEAHGLTPTAFVREATFAYIRQKYLVPKSLASALHDHTLALLGVCNNINQIARKVNSTGKVGLFDLYKIHSAVGHMEKMVTDFIKHPPISR